MSEAPSRLPFIARAVLLAALALLALLAAVHTPWVEDAVGRWALNRLRLTGITAQVGSLRYNLITRRIRIEDARLQTAASPTEPFFVARAIDISVPWSVLAARWAVDSIQIEQPEVVLHRRADASTNWPSVAAGAGGPSVPLPIRRVLARDLSVTWTDEVQGADARATGISIDLVPGGGGAVGRLTAARDVQLRWDDYRTRVTGETQLAWDGARLTLTEARVLSPEITLTGGGVIGLLTPRPELAMTLALSAPKLEWRGLTDMAIEAGARVDIDGVDVDRVEARAVGATLQARGRVSFDERAMSRLSAEWQGVDVARVIAAIDEGRRIPIATVSNGKATATFTARRADAVTLSIDATLTTTKDTGTTKDGTTKDTTSTKSAQGSETTLPKAAERVGLHGTLSARADRGAWTADVDQWIDDAVHVDGSARGRLSAAMLAQSTLAGQLRATADAAPALWRVLETLNVAPAGVPPAIGGSAQADVTLAGTISDARADALIAVSDWRQGPVAAISVTSRVSVSRRDVQVSTLEARRGANTLHAQVSATFGDNRVRGHVEASVPAVGDILVDRVAFLPSGSVELSAELTGRLTAPIVDGHVTGEQVRVAGQRADRLTATVHADRRSVTLSALELTQADGRLEASGAYELSTGRVSGKVSATNVVVTPIVNSAGRQLDVGAFVDADVSVAGTVDDVRGQGTATLRDARWEDRRFGVISNTFTLTGHRLESSFQLPDVFVTGDASLAIAPLGDFVVDAQVDGGDLAVLTDRLALAAAVPISGTASTHAHASGRVDQPSQARVQVDLQQLDARVGDVPVRATTTGTVTYDERGLASDDLVFDVAGGSLRAGGTLGRTAGGTIHLSLDAPLRDAMQTAKTFVPADSATPWPDADGHVTLAAQITGTLDRPELEATTSVDEGAIAFAGLPAATGVALRASYDAGLLMLSQLSASWQGASISATGEAPVALFASRLPDWLLRAAPRREGPAHLVARLDNVTPAMLTPWVDADRLTQFGGAASGTLTLDAGSLALSALSGELMLDRAEVSAAGVRFEQQLPTRVALQGSSLRIASWTWGAEGNRVVLGGTVNLDAPRTLDLTMDGTIDMRALGAFLPDVTTSGRGVLNARVGGTLDLPQWDGRIDLERGEIRVASPPFIASDLTGHVLLTSDAVTISDFYGDANGGTLSVAGRFGYAGLHPTDGRLAVTARGLAMAVPDQLKTAVDADLSLSIVQGRVSLGGDVTVLDGAYREPLSLTSGLLRALQQSDPIVEVASEPSAIDRIVLDLRLTTSQDIVVDNNYAQLGLGADLRLRGTLAQPVLTGRAEAREGGRIFLGGHVYQLSGNGSVDFSTPSRIEPDLDITALTRVGGREITLTLKGTPARLESTLTSDPPLAQSDIVSLLVTGNVQSDSGPIPTIGRDQLLSYLSGEVLGIAGRRVGLDTLRVEAGTGVRFDAGLIATETDPGSRLTFGKQVTPDVDVAFSQNLRDAGEFTWIVAYHPRSNIELRVVSDDANNRLYDFRHDVTIGGTSNARPVTRAERPRVGTVTFTGAPGPFEKALRDTLSLKTGHTFDFFKWQQDRDALEALCRKRAHFEARIAARRSDSTASSGAVVDLEYDVRLGRETVVDIVGAPRPKPLQRAIEALWSRAVFDALLVDEATKAARAIAIEDGYLLAMVSVVLQPRGTDQTHLILTMVPGSRFDRRRIVFAGNRAIDAERLNALIAARGFDRTAWLDPAPLTRTVGELYRDQGFFSAKASAAPPVFAASSATLTVTIDEGAPARLEGLEWVGVQRLPVGEVQKAFGLQPGVVLTREATTLAVRSLARYYEMRGFNRASVEVSAGPRLAAGDIVLTVTVNEGAQQVLQNVSIEGTRRTSQTLVSRELRLDVGAPVDPSTWEEARKRLYETGVFRLVDVEAVPVLPEGPASEDVAVQPVRAQVTVQEWPPMRLRYGFQLDDERTPASESRQLKPGAAGDLTYKNLFGRAASAGIAARATADFRAARGFFTTPTFFGLPITSNVFLGRSREQVGESDRSILTDKLELTLEQRIGRRGRPQLAYSYTFQRNHTFDLNADPDDPLAFDLTVNVARLTGTGLVDTRDDLLDATRGQLFTATFEYGAGPLGSDVRFVKQIVSEFYYRSLGRGLVIASAGRVGLAAGQGQELITSERFFTGGGNTVRGYEENSLGPRDPFFNDAAGGNALLLLNQELRFPIFWRLRGVGFVDAGNVFDTVGDVRFGALRVGTGVGVRVQTPFALLRVDLGTPVGRRTGEPRLQWFFSIGQAF